MVGVAGVGVARAIGALESLAPDEGSADVNAGGDASTTSATSGADNRNIIQIENARPGTADFSFPQETAVQGLVEGYLNTDSAHRGETVTLYASTDAPSFTVEAFRFGYYGGAGARKVWEHGQSVAGVKQPGPVVDHDTNMRECHWSPSLEITIGDDWTPGMYLFRLLRPDGNGAFVPLVVLDDRDADLLVISAITTWNAYNKWGGASLYEGVDGRAYVVSFDRPQGSGHFFGGEFEFVQLVESLGIDVAYTTNIDLHARPEQTTARGYKAVASLAHDEYYSLEMRQALEAARDAGVNLMFLGANAIFRRVRLEPSALGPHRRLVNYRNPKKDPLYGKDDVRTTAEWRFPPAANPECSLIGNYYEANPVQADMVVADADAWVFAGTGLKNGDVLPGLVGNEYDRVTPEAPGTPANIQVLCHSPLMCKGKHSFADVTYYTAPSGAGVFATGTLWWERQLGPLCEEPMSSADEGHTVECYVRRITVNVLNAFLAGPAGNAHPSVPNLEQLGIHRGYVAHPPS